MPEEPQDGAGGAGAVLTGRLDGNGSVRRGLPRTFDILLAFVGLIVASPVLFLAAVSIAVTSGLPVLFRQTRVGRAGRPFTLVKLRSMRHSRGGAKVTVQGDQRVTPVGRFLRRTKLDELPELWNVLRGDMALVGPRPEVPELVDLRDPLWEEALRVRPGLTDPVTVSLRDEESVLAAVEGDRERYYRETLQPAKLRGYVDYLRNRSWQSDLRVLLLTLAAIVLPGRGGRGGPPASPTTP